MERLSVNLLQNGEVAAKYQILAVFSLEKSRENKFCTTYNNPVKWDWETTLIQFHR